MRESPGQGKKMASGFLKGVATGFVISALTAGWLFLVVESEAGGSASGGCNPVYFATTNDGRIMQLAPLNQPNITEVALISWVAMTASDALSFGFNDRQARMHKNAPSFDAAGWKAFLAVLAARGWDEKSDRLQPYYVTAPAAAPAIRQQGVKDSIYTWVLDVPLVMTVKTPGNMAGESIAVNVTITVQRARDLNKYNGIEITGFSLSEEAPR